MPILVWSKVSEAITGHQIIHSSTNICVYEDGAWYEEKLEPM